MTFAWPGEMPAVQHLANPVVVNGHRTGLAWCGERMPEFPPDGVVLTCPTCWSRSEVWRRAANRLRLGSHPPMRSFP